MRLADVVHELRSLRRRQRRFVVRHPAAILVKQPATRHLKMRGLGEGCGGMQHVFVGREGFGVGSMGDGGGCTSQPPWRSERTLLEGPAVTA